MDDAKLLPWRLEVTGHDGVTTASHHATRLTALRHREERYSRDAYGDVVSTRVRHRITGTVVPEPPSCGMPLCVRRAAHYALGLGVRLCDPHYMEVSLAQMHAHGLYPERVSGPARERYDRLCRALGICAAPLCWLETDATHCPAHTREDS